MEREVAVGVNVTLLGYLMGCLPMLEMKLAGLHAELLNVRRAVVNAGRGSIEEVEGQSARANTANAPACRQALFRASPPEHVRVQSSGSL